MGAPVGKVHRAIRLVVQSALDRAAVFGTRRREGNVVAVVRVDAIGDFIVWLAAARRLCALYRPRRIVLIANLAVVDLARATGLFDEVIGVDIHAFLAEHRYRFGLIRRVCELGATVALQPTHSRNFRTGDALVRATGAAERIGYETDLNNIRPWQRRISDRWYTRLVPAASVPMHELQRNADFLKGMGDEPADATIGRLDPVGAPPDDLTPEGPYFIIVPGAGSSLRMWPIARFAEVVREIARRRGWRPVICGSAAEEGLATELASKAGLDETVVLAGRTALPELVELVRHAEMVIANETSAIHIAAAVETPSVCILGGGHFGRFVPYPAGAAKAPPVPVYVRMPCFGCNWRCTQPHEPGGPAPCITKIETDAVLAAADTCSREPICPKPS